VAERRLQLIIEWLEQNPRVYADVFKRITNLNKSYEGAKAFLIDTTKSADEQAGTFAALKDTYADNLTQIVRTDRGFRIVQDSLRKQEEAANASRKRWDLLSKRVINFGKQMGFIGWVSSFALRTLMRIATSAFKTLFDLVELTADWPTSIEKVYTAMALLESQGMLTAKTEQMLAGTIEDLTTIGPQAEAATAGLEAAKIRLATIISTTLTPALVNFINRLADILARTDVQIMLMNLGSAFGNLLLAIIPVIPILVPLITGFVKLLNALSPLFPVLIPLAAIIFTLGLVIQALGPVITIVGIILEGFTILWGFLTSAKVANTVATAANTTAQAASIPVSSAAAAASGALTAVLWAFVPAALAVAAVALAIAIAIMTFVVAVAFLTGRLGELASGLKDIIGALKGMCFLHAAENAAVMSDQLTDTTERVDDLRSSLRGLRGGLGGGGVELAHHSPAALEATGPVSQTVYASISIGAVTGSVDLDEVQSAVSRGIADSLRRAK